MKKLLIAAIASASLTGIASAQDSRSTGTGIGGSTGSHTSSQTSGGDQTAIAETGLGERFDRVRANMGQHEHEAAFETLTSETSVTFQDIADLEQDEATMADFMAANSANIDSFRTTAMANPNFSARAQSEGVDPNTMVGYDQSSDGNMTIYTNHLGGDGGSIGSQTSTQSSGVK